jgi:DNA-binding NarL/FixJ family response regulator
MQRIVILMDRAVTAAAVGDAISRHHGLLIVATGTDLDAVLSGEGAVSDPVAPDVVVLDRGVPQVLAASLADVRARWPDAAVVMLEGLDGVESLVETIRAATGDLTVLTAAAVARARDQLRSSVARSPVMGYPQLTPRERDVLALLSKGMSPSQIAVDLRISLNTCRGYLRTLMAKLGARSQREVVAFVAEHGLPTGGS